MAGTGTQAFGGNGQPAAQAWFSGPEAVAVDAIGDLFIADQFNSQVRKVDANGIVTVVAGQGPYGYFGDGGQATQAALYGPTGLAVGPAGDLFIADTGNNRIRKVDGPGIITTVAGNGSIAISGDSDSATQAGLDLPAGVAVDATGDLFIADFLGHRIRKVFGSVSIVPGDLNGDGIVEARDVDLTLRIFLGLQAPTAAELAAGDVRPKPGTGVRSIGDGRIGPDDVNWIFRKFVGLETDP